MESPDKNQHPKIDKLIETLGIDLDLTGREIAEILWLSLKRQELMLRKKKEKTKTKIDAQNSTIDNSVSLKADEKRTSRKIDPQNPTYR